jgi:hypothetical protein
VSITEICLHNRYNEWYYQIKRAQDAIGWWRLMEGMVCNEIWAIQTTYLALSGSQTSAKKWTVKFITKLLMVTHGQWLYHNIQVNDKVAGTLAMLRKEEIQIEIEGQQALGVEDLLEEDCYLGECNLGDLQDTLGITETYWLFAIKAARWKAFRLEALRVQMVTVDFTT